MTVSLKAKNQPTPCGGTLDSLINVTNNTAQVKFSNVKECALCPECPFRLFCPVERDIISIEVKAFTGMQIGVLPITRSTKSFIEITTKANQVIRFDRKSGVQTNCTNSRFANRVNPKDIPPYSSASANGVAN